MIINLFIWELQHVMTKINITYTVHRSVHLNYISLKDSDVLTLRYFFVFILLPRIKNSKQYIIETNASSFFKWDDVKRLLMYLF